MKALKSPVIGGALALLVVAASAALAWGAGAVVVAAKPAAIQWPTPNKAFMQNGDIAAWAQDTGTGDPHSGLFGCVRDDAHKFHEGLDIKSIQRDKKGEPLDAVSAALEGRVAYIETVGGSGDYGRYVVLEHVKAEVPVYTLYGHLAAIAPGLKVGQTVAAGATIGTMGHSGTENIPVARSHVHFEIGLRLSDNFQAYYDAEKLPGKNEHGNFNGINLVGTDPQAFFEQVRTGKFKNFLEYFHAMPTAFTLRVTTTRIPDFAARYPGLVAKPVPAAGVAGWDVAFTWYGLPKELTPLAAGTPGLGAPGAVALVSYDRAQFTGCTCRDTLIFPADKNASPTIGKYLGGVIRMLFSFK